MVFKNLPKNIFLFALINYFVDAVGNSGKTFQA